MKHCEKCFERVTESADEGFRGVSITYNSCKDKACECHTPPTEGSKENRRIGGHTYDDKGRDTCCITESREGWEESLEEQPIFQLLNSNDPIYGQENWRAKTALRDFIEDLLSRTLHRERERVVEMLEEYRNVVNDKGERVTTDMFVDTIKSRIKQLENEN